MLKSRMKRRAADGIDATKRLAQIKLSIAAMPDEDLLDLADIVAAQDGTPLFELASAEMKKRGISL